MPLFKDMAGLLHAPVGNNLENNSYDIENFKRNFANEGRYKRPIENGYLDQELNDSIWSFQKDYNLKQDGIAIPGGETEATLISALRGYDKPKNKPKPDIDQVAAPAVPFAVPALASRLAPLLGGITIMEAWKKWRSDTTDGRQLLLRRLDEKEDQESNDEKCERVLNYYTRICDRVFIEKGPQEAAKCRARAMDIYSSCRAGNPENSWPPFEY